MTRLLQRKETGLGRMVAVSTVLHLAFYFFLLKFHFPQPYPKEGPIYYVDVVNLPVAHPQAGTPSAGGEGAPPAAPPAAAPREMALPATTKVPPPPLKKLEEPVRTAEEAREFEKRLAGLERAAEAKHEAAALEAIRRRAAGSGRPGERAGMPGATGTEAGSDYASYIQSRLKDAFSATIAFQSKNPEVVIRLTIDRSGRVTATRIERSSGDRVFEGAALRAISKAEKGFPPPPGGTAFEHGFIFRPQGVVKR